MTEWYPVPGYASVSVNNEGVVYSGNRERILKQFSKASGHLCVQLSKVDTLDGKGRHAQVHRLIALARIPNPAGHPLVRHLDDDPTNNRIENLAWGTYRDNAQDALRNGKNYLATRTACSGGHDYSLGEWSMRGGSRQCLICERVKRRANRIKRSEETPFDKIPHGYGGYTNYLCRCDVCKNADANHRKSRG